MTLPLDRIPFNRPDWQKVALCRRPGIDSRVFFPADEDKGVKQAEARRICDMCLAKLQCLDYALDNRSEGIWGGTSTAERNKIRKKRSRAKCPVCRSEDVVRQQGATLVTPQEVCLSCGNSWPAAAPFTIHRGRTLPEAA